MENLEALNQRFENAAPQEILRWAYDTFGTRAALVTSFQITGVATLHMLQQFVRDLPVLTLDTEFLFPESYDLIEEVEDYFGIRVERLRPDPREAVDLNLWQTNPDACCDQRKVQPLERALKNYDAWFTGLRRDQSSSRTQTPIISQDRRHGNIKIAPFATWTEDMLWTYIHAYDLPYNALHDQGYPSIGCTNCTRAVAAGEDTRSGRWSGRLKTECGIHLSTLAVETRS